MTDEMDLTPLVRSWLRDTLPPATASSHLLEAVDEQVPTIRQQRHPWPPLTRARRRVVASGPATRFGHASVTPANGLVRTMWSQPSTSAIGFVVGGVIVALLSGFLLGSLSAPDQPQPVPAAPVSTPEMHTAAVGTEPPPGAYVEGGGTILVPGVDMADGVPAYKYNNLLWFVKDDHWCRIVIATEFGLDVTEEALAQCHAWIAQSPWGRNNDGQERVLLPETWAIRIADRAGWSSVTPTPPAPTDRRSLSDR